MKGETLGIGPVYKMQISKNLQIKEKSHCGGSTGARNDATAPPGGRRKRYIVDTEYSITGDSIFEHDFLLKDPIGKYHKPKSEHS